MKKITVPDIRDRKSGKKIVMLTSYDAITARIVDEAGVDIILVGDSLGNVIQGEKTTLGVTIEDMIYHTKIVSRVVKNAHVCADMPFMSYQISKEEALKNAGRLIKDSNGESVKLELNEYYIDTIYSITNAGIPVMAHIGLCPQSYHMIGGYKMQGKRKSDSKKYTDLAKSAEQAGAYSLVLESVPLELARIITDSINIPTIGIGAGPHCDGQVLVINDLVGLNTEKPPKFVKQYADFRESMTNAVHSFCTDVCNKVFPDIQNSYSWNRK
jgi:3-methyl-2-oxobutanoate hydroxymethyltransferase